MHTEGQTHRRGNRSGWWVCLAVEMLLGLLGCVAPATTRRAVAPLTPAPATMAAPATYVLEDIRLSSTRETTHVVITVSGPVQPLVQRLSQPERLEIALPETQLAQQWNQHDVPVADGRLQTVQVAQSQPSRVRITLLLQEIRDYRIAVQLAPHRLTVELLGAMLTGRTSARAGKKGVSRLTLAPSAALTPIIFIDPGHGGHDPGAIGPSGLEEKTVVLQVAKELRQLMQQEMPQYRVALTREQDVFVPLAERARMANAQQAQVFISIHTNSSPHREASGVETWYLSFAASARAKKIAARENMMSEQQLSILELILRDMHETDRINQSAVLALSTQQALAEHLAAHYPGVIRRGVEGAPFAVLHRTMMPSVLVETGFISNPHEEARLRTRQYQRALAQGILRGLRQFLQTAIVAMY
jgi:N-acetylmuramoyl-L-alanine amidase